MSTKQEIVEKYRQIHDILTKQYYVDKTIDEATFDAQHSQNWQDMNVELLANGYLKQIWRYSIGATITTALGDIAVEVKIDSPIQLSEAQIQNIVDKLKTASWALKQTTETLIEI